LKPLGPFGIESISVRRFSHAMAKEWQATAGDDLLTINGGRRASTVVGHARFDWQAGIVAQAFYDQSKARHLPHVVFWMNTVEHGSSRLGDYVSGRIQRHPPGEATILRRLKALQLTPVSIGRVRFPWGVAYAVRAETSQPKAFVAAHYYPEGAVWGDTARCSGTYLEVDNPQGRPILISAQSPTGGGLGWVLPSLRRPAQTPAIPG
jgi:hypothetical protein